jgi:hypothetical protein
MISQLLHGLAGGMQGALGIARQPQTPTTPTATPRMGAPPTEAGGLPLGGPNVPGAPSLGGLAGRPQRPGQQPPLQGISPEELRWARLSTFAGGPKETELEDMRQRLADAERRGEITPAERQEALRQAVTSGSEAEKLNLYRKEREVQRTEQQKAIEEDVKAIEDNRQRLKDAGFTDKDIELMKVEAQLGRSVRVPEATEKLPARIAERRKIEEIIENKDGKYSETDIADAKKEKQYMDAQVDQAVDRVQVQKRQLATGKDIVPGTPEFQIAQDLAYGKLTFQDFRTIYSYSRNEQKREGIYLKARELNPSFNPAEFEAGYKFAARPQTRQQLASLDNVEAGVNDLLRLSDAATRAGATVLNRFVSPGGYAIGNRNFTSFQVARTAFADELSGALGYGSTTDMSRAMGFDMTDPTLSPENFRRNIEQVIWPFLNRKRDSLLNEMGPYAEPERKRAEDVQTKVGLTPEGLPRPSREGARPTPALVKRYYDYFRDKQKAKEALRNAGWQVD